MAQEKINENRWLVIVNPNAGKKKGEKDWPIITGLLEGAGFEFESLFTAQRGHALSLTVEYIQKGYRKIIIVGGDGTLNEVVNGVFLQDNCITTDITLGMIMVGTGNDWGRMYNLKGKYEKAVKILKKQRIFVQDAAKVSYFEGPEEKERYFVNMAGLGYDALVAQMTNHMKDQGGGGPLAYLLNLVRGLFRYNNTSLEVEVDGQLVYSGQVFSMSVGICKFNGGGMMQLPYAVPDDGILDITLFKQVTKMTVVRNLKKLYDGTFTHLPFVQVHTGKTVTVKSLTRQQSYLETDGESLGHGPFRFGIIPKSIKVITGKNWQEKNQPV